MTQSAGVLEDRREEEETASTTIKLTTEGEGAWLRSSDIPPLQELCFLTLQRTSSSEDLEHQSSALAEDLSVYPMESLATSSPVSSTPVSYTHLTLPTTRMV